MSRQTTLDSLKELRLVNDKPIRLLFLAEAISNIGFIGFIFFYPKLFLSFFLKPEKDITPLTTHVLFWWNTWLVVITGLMFAAIPSKYNTPTLTAGLIHVRRFLYFGLLGSEVFLALLLILTPHRTTFAVGTAIFCILVVIGRLIVLFPKQLWFGTVLIDSPTEKNKQR